MNRRWICQPKSEVGFGRRTCKVLQNHWQGIDRFKHSEDNFRRPAHAESKRQDFWRFAKSSWGCSGRIIQAVNQGHDRTVGRPATQVAFLLACHCSTSKVEQSFSFLELFSSGRKGRTKETNLRRRSSANQNFGPVFIAFNKAIVIKLYW